MNNITTLDHNAEFFREILEEYKRTRNIDNSRIRQDLTKEEAISSDYRGREVYELIQNAEDQNSEYVDIKLNAEDHTLTVSNGGTSCEPFSQSGFSSIMMSDMSPKFISKLTYIGHKGLGFRSLLNWADEITIISSGVQCTFSREIARDNWVEIKRHLSPDVAQAHEEFAKSFPHNCPVAMLSTPRVVKANDTIHTTSIIIKYRPDCYESIHQQLSSLSGKVLLFLKNITKISISTDKGSYAIHKELSRRINDHIITTRTLDRNHYSPQEWYIYHTEGTLDRDKKYQVAIAYDATGRESGQYIYSFFPTRVPLDKPFVLHATFDLNSSRNAINLTADNDRVQHHIATAIVEFAEYLASIDTFCRDKWLYHSFLSLSPDALPITAGQLATIIDKAKVFPTVANGYQILAHTRHYSESMAGFLSTNVRRFEHFKQLGSHLICGFTEANIPAQDYDAQLGQIFNDFSRHILPRIPVQSQIPMRADVITALVDVENCQPMALLVDEEGSIIDDDAFINIGESIPYLPDDLKINYVKDDLIRQLLHRFELEGDKSRRTLVQLLRSNNCVDVSELNISAARDKIITYSHNMSAIGFRRLMFALFYRLECDPIDDDRINLLFSNERFQILSAANSHVYPSEVVLDPDLGDSGLPSKWRLLGSIDEWVTWFREIHSALGIPKYADRITASAVADFFHDKVGVSRKIPMNYVMLDRRADDYIRTCSSTLASGKLNLSLYDFYSRRLEERNNQNHYNRSKIIKTDFIDYLHNDRRQSLAQIIKLIINDPVSRHEFGNTTLYYLYYSPKPEVVKISYSLYCLRRHPVFAPLKHYVVSERMYLLNDPNIEQQLNDLADKPEYALFLSRLGARERVSDLSLSELYDVLLSLPDRQLKSGIQKIYRLLREAINARRKDAEFEPLAKKFAEIGKVYARVGNTLNTIPAADAYYWDNDQLPRRILDTKPKLDIGNRVGEDSVKAIFGVRLAKDIMVNIDRHVPNVPLDKAIARHLRERVRYILAYRIHNSREIRQDKDKRLIATHIRAIKIKIHTTCSYNDDGQLYTMSPGDMIFSQKEFHIVSTYSSIDDALRNPTFCENISEAICMSLKVTSSDMANCFRRIIKDSIEENRYIADKEISPEEWADVDRALGLSDFEKKLWNALNTDVDFDRLAIISGTDKTAYLRSLIPAIVLPDAVGDIAELSPGDRYSLLRSLNLDNVGFLGPDCLRDYYAATFKSMLSQYDKSFFEYTYKQTMADNRLSPYNYFDRCLKYRSGDWCTPVIERIAARVVSPDEIHRLFAAVVRDTFDVVVDRQIIRNSDFTPAIRPEYLKILSDNHLDSSNIDQRIMALAIFDGYTDEFSRCIQKHIVPIPAPPVQHESNQPVILEIIDAVAIDKPISILGRDDGHAGGQGGGGGGYSSEAAKILSGRNAEIIVLESMSSQPNRYSCIKGVSRNLDPVNGNDCLHYDIQYKLAGSNDLRYLEVKSMTHDTVYMSVDEYNFACENSDAYDMAIVHKGKVHIVSSPFATTAGHQPLTAHPSAYRLSISLK